MAVVVAIWLGIGVISAIVIGCCYLPTAWREDRMFFFGYLICIWPGVVLAGPLGPLAYWNISRQQKAPGAALGSDSSSRAESPGGATPPDRHSSS